MLPRLAADLVVGVAVRVAAVGRVVLVGARRARRLGREVELEHAERIARGQAVALAEEEVVRALRREARRDDERKVAAADREPRGVDRVRGAEERARARPVEQPLPLSIMVH